MSVYMKLYVTMTYLVSNLQDGESNPSAEVSTNNDHTSLFTFKTCNLNAE